MIWMMSALLACGEPTPAAPAETWASFGTPATLTASAPVATVLGNPAPLVGSLVSVEGRVSNVCAKAGCWLVLADDQGHEVRVTMKGHGFAVPKDCSGQTARIEGMLLEKVTDPAVVQHYESEQTGAAVPEKGTEKHYEIEATSVRLKQG